MSSNPRISFISFDNPMVFPVRNEVGKAKARLVLWRQPQLKPKCLIKLMLPLLMVILAGQVLLVTGPAIADPMSVLSNLNQAFTQINNKVIPAVVLISLVRGGSSFFGSGFIISNDGLIMTNSHLIADVQDLEVTIFDSRQRFKAQIVGLDRDTDVGLIRVETRGLPFLKLGDSSKLHVGQIVFSVGNPLGIYSWSATFGIISATGRTNVGLIPDTDMIQTNALMNPGNSGGPLVNVRGEVVGITTGNRPASPGLSWVIPIDSAKLVMDDLLKHGKVLRGYLGINGFRNLTRMDAVAHGLPDNRGVLVTSILAGSPADQVGIKAGDVILSYNGNIVDDSNQFKILVAEARPGKTARLSISRNGKVLEFDVTFS